MPHAPLSPIFCDNCSSFAMAELDGALLCTGCLMSAVLSSRDPALPSRILPLLPLAAPRSRSKRERLAEAV
jgi:hypothetical protein